MNKATIAALKRAGIVLPEGTKVLEVNMSWVGKGADPKPNKYGAKPTEYGGVRYDSKAEAKRAEALDGLRQAGAVAWWIAQPRFRLGCTENVYVADFLVVDPLGDGVHVEDVKGQETSKFKRDKKLWRSYGPCPLWIIKGGKVAEIIEGGGSK